MSETWQGYGFHDLHATCDYCNQPLFSVWWLSDPLADWLECGGVGNGCCNFRSGMCIPCGREGFAITDLDPETGHCKDCHK